MPSIIVIIGDRSARKSLALLLISLTKFSGNVIIVSMFERSTSRLIALHGRNYHPLLKKENSCSILLATKNDIGILTHKAINGRKPPTAMPNSDAMVDIVVLSIYI